jgi:cytochrome c-type biogenesis protein CcmH
MDNKFLLRLVIAVAALVLLPAVALAERHADGEIALEQRLMAPCCWVQTLDVHDSPIARELRAEVRARLSKGEAAASIERDFVSRYGERIVAMPVGNPLAKTAAVAGLAILVVGGLVVMMLRRWLRAGRPPARPQPAGGPVARDEWDDRLDQELKDD